MNKKEFFEEAMSDEGLTKETMDKMMESDSDFMGNLFDLSKTIMNMLAESGDKLAGACLTEKEIRKNFAGILGYHLKIEREKLIKDRNSDYPVEEFEKWKKQRDEKLYDFFMQIKLETDNFIKDNNYEIEE